MPKHRTRHELPIPLALTYTSIKPKQEYKLQQNQQNLSEHNSFSNDMIYCSTKVKLHVAAVQFACTFCGM